MTRSATTSRGVRGPLARLAAVTAVTAALCGLSIPAAVLAQTAAPSYTAPRTPDGHPDLQGIWQAVNTAVWNLEDHEGELGVPPGQSVVRAATSRTCRPRWPNGRRTTGTAAPRIRKRSASWWACRASPTCRIRLRSCRWRSR